MKTRTLFIATGEYAVPVLEGLLQSEQVDVIGIVTQPDKPVGRKQELEGGPIKKYWHARNLEIPIFQPVKLRLESQQILEQTKPELVIVVAYGQMIPDDMLNYPKFKALNIHGSLLPALRGAVPIQSAILKGLPKTGVTLQVMVKEMDAGPIVATCETEISADDTTETLMAKMSLQGRDLLLSSLSRWLDHQIVPVEQDHSQATFCYQSDISKEKAEITPETDVLQAERMIRGYYPWPIAWMNLGNQRLKIFKARIASGKNASKLIEREGKGLFLQLQNGRLELLELQLEGKQRRGVGDYLFLAD